MAARRGGADGTEERAHRRPSVVFDTALDENVTSLESERVTERLMEAIEEIGGHRYGSGNWQKNHTIHGKGAPSGAPKSLETLGPEGSANFGYNAATGEHGDLVETGAVDPSNVTRTALQNAPSNRSRRLCEQGSQAIEQGGSQCTAACYLPVARTRHIDPQLVHDAAARAALTRLHYEHPVRRQQGFVHIVRHHERSHAMRRRDLQQEVLQTHSRNGIDCAERFVEQQHARTRKQPTCYCHALCHATREFLRPARFHTRQADIG